MVALHVLSNHYRPWPEFPLDERKQEVNSFKFYFTFLKVFSQENNQLLPSSETSVNQHNQVRSKQSYKVRKS